MANEELNCSDALSSTDYSDCDLEKIIAWQGMEVLELQETNEELARQVARLSAQVSELTAKLKRLNVRLADGLKVNVALNCEMYLSDDRGRQLRDGKHRLTQEREMLKRACATMDEKVRAMEAANRNVADHLTKYDDTFIDIRSSGQYDEMKLKEAVQDVASDLGALALNDVDDGEYAGDVADAACAVVSRHRWLAGSKDSSVVSFDACVGEVYALRWPRVRDTLVAAGSHGCMRVWRIAEDLAECQGTYLGCDSGVTSLDHDSGDLVALAGSNDHHVRLWTVADQVLRRTFIGHGGPVTAVRFLGEAESFISASHDRTLKIWDLNAKRCVMTLFSPSKCSDIVIYEGGPIVSGHVDRLVQLWDPRRGNGSLMNFAVKGEITCLDLTHGTNYLLCCMKDHPMKLIDIRMNKTLSSFDHENFQVKHDCARAAISFDGRHVAAGSSDGSVFVWNVKSGAIESQLTGHVSTVTTVAWDQRGKSLASADVEGIVTIWKDPLKLLAVCQD